MPEHLEHILRNISHESQKEDNKGKDVFNTPDHEHMTQRSANRILIDTVERAGRGLDIPFLSHVIVLVPLFVNMQIQNITERSLKQAMGRVARGGINGSCTFLLIGDVFGEIEGRAFGSDD